MVSIRYFCGVGEFCSTKSNPRGCRTSNSDAGAAARYKAMQATRTGTEAMRIVAVSKSGTLAVSISRPLADCTLGSDDHRARGSRVRYRDIHSLTNLSCPCPLLQSVNDIPIR